MGTSTIYRVESALLGILLTAAVALAIYAFVVPTPHAQRFPDFKISGGAITLLYPGGRAARVDLDFTNPNSFPITVRKVRVKIAGSSSAECPVSEFVVNSQLAGTVRVAPGVTKSLSQLGILRADWPRVAMLDAPEESDGCEGSSLRLSYAGEATEAIPADTPGAVAWGRVYVDGRRFERGGLGYGARVLIMAGGNLELRTQSGPITVYPEAGKWVRFIVHRGFAVPPIRPRGVAMATFERPRRLLYTELELIGGELWRCPVTPSPGAGDRMQSSANGAASPTARGLWARGSGRLRVRGRSGVSTGSDAWWLTQDGCPGTFVKVKSATVAVDGVTARGPRFVKAGHSYTARARVGFGPPGRAIGR